MPARFVTIDRDTPLLLTTDLRDTVPHNHLCHFIVDAATELDLPRIGWHHGCCFADAWI
jgi:hypothetical protein